LRSSNAPRIDSAPSLTRGAARGTLPKNAATLAQGSRVLCGIRLEAGDSRLQDESPTKPEGERDSRPCAVAVPTLMPFGEHLRGSFLPQEGPVQLCTFIVHRTQPAQMERPRHAISILCVGIDLGLLKTRMALLTSRGYNSLIVTAARAFTKIDY